MIIIQKRFLLLLLLFTSFMSSLYGAEVVKIADILFQENQSDAQYEKQLQSSIAKIKEARLPYATYHVDVTGDTSCGDVYEKYASKVEDALIDGGIAAKDIRVHYYRQKGGVSDCSQSRRVTIMLSLQDRINNDIDGDGVVNAVDKCPNTPANTPVNLQGCVLSTEVVLLDGRKKHTAIIVKTPKGSVVIDKPLVGVSVGADATISPPKKVSKAELQAITGDILQTSNQKQYRFVLYFNKLDLTKASKQELQKMLQKLASLSKPYINITGHTDTIDTVEHNKILGLKRAQKIAEYIKKANVDYLKMDISSDSELNLAVQTPDETREARNRRVVVLIQ